MSEEQTKPRRVRARAPEVESAESSPSEEVGLAPAARETKPGLLHRVQLDPATGLALFVPGLFVMAVGGAATWHWIFNAGEAVMLLGMTYFVAAVALTALQQRSQAKRPGGPAELPTGG